jgi:hypothetical protein
LRPFSASPRVVLVEDDEQAALPVLKALAHEGIVAAWYSAQDSESLPKEKLEDVRLLILDLDLRGASGVDVKDTAGVVTKILAPTDESGPCIFLLWTKHPDRANDVMSAVVKYSKSTIYTDYYLIFNKSDFYQDDAFQAEKMIKDLRKGVSEFAPMDFLFNWESCCSKAGAVALNKIFNLATLQTMNQEKDSNGHLTNMLFELAKALGGKRISDVDSNEKLLFLRRTLGVIHADAVRHAAETNPDPAETSLFSRSTSNLDSETKSIINHILLTSPDTVGPAPGTCHPVDINLSQWIGFKPHKEIKEYRRFLARIFGKSYRVNKSCICDQCKMVVVDLSPPCDYAQNKLYRHRLAPALIVPLNLSDHVVSKSNYLKKIGPLRDDDSACCLVVDSLCMFTLPMGTTLPEALFRLRNHVAVDLQAWLGAHLARPGHLSL